MCRPCPRSDRGRQLAKRPEHRPHGVQDPGAAGLAAERPRSPIPPRPCGKSILMGQPWPWSAANRTPSAQICVYAMCINAGPVRDDRNERVCGFHVCVHDARTAWVLSTRAPSNVYTRRFRAVLCMCELCGVCSEIAHVSCAMMGCAPKRCSIPVKSGIYLFNNR